jgi:hypothetical protein
VRAIATSLAARFGAIPRLIAGAAGVPARRQDGLLLLAGAFVLVALAGASAWSLRVALRLARR